MTTAFMNCRRTIYRQARFVSLLLLSACAFPLYSRAQVNSGSDGSDGAFIPTATNTVINMADHPDGIYQFTSVNISNGVTVTFIPNANNTPVTWLVQGDCTIGGTISLQGVSCNGVTGTAGGPGGFAGGNGALGAETPAGAGLGPGGGNAGVSPSPNTNFYGGSGSFATLGGQGGDPSWWGIGQTTPGEVYGNIYLVPLLGGSGGGGRGYVSGGGGGGGGGAGAILIAASGKIQIDGTINANGGDGTTIFGYRNYAGEGGGGSGGAIRLVATTVSGSGSLLAVGGQSYVGWVRGGYNDSWPQSVQAGSGRIRIDRLTDSFTGPANGVITRGFQSIIIPPPNQTISLSIYSVAGVAVPANPVGSLLTPDVVVPGNQQNPVSIIVHCANIPLNTEIVVEVKPANGSTVRVAGINNTGTMVSSTAALSVHMPRGGGTIQAKAVSGIAGNLYGEVRKQNRINQSLAATGWTASGDRFAAVEVTATLGGSQQIAYVTESGARYFVPSVN